LLKTIKHISEIIKNLDREDRLIITHGNGPQVCNLMVQQGFLFNTRANVLNKKFLM